jgi:hypothetical protein
LQSLTTGQKNAEHSPLIKPEKVYSPPSISNLDSQNNSVKAMNQNNTGFMCQKYNFPKKSDDKIKVGVFVGPQIKELMQDVKF